MSTNQYIKGFYIGRQSDSKILFKFSRIASKTAESLEDETVKHIQKYFKVDEEQKQFEINKTHETIAHEGIYYTLIDDKCIVYSTLMSELYPSNQAQVMLNKIKKELKNMPDYQKQSEKTIQNYAKGFIVNIIDEFDSETIVQEAIKASEQKQNEIEDIHIQIEQNLKQLMTDHSHPSNFSTADQKLSPELEQLRLQQENNKEELKAKTKEANKQEVQEMQKKQLKNAVSVRNLKIKIIVCIVITAIVLYAVVPLF